MKSIFIVFLIFQFNFLFSQENELRNCNVKYQIDSTNFSQSGLFKLQITNLGSHKIRIPKSFDMMRIQAQNAEKYDKDSKKYIEINNRFVDVNCLYCNEKQFALKPTKNLNIFWI